MEGVLACGSCQAAFPIRRGVPRFASTLPAGDVSDTIDAFGYQWTRANAVFRSARASSTDVFLDFIHPVAPSSFAGRTVLDAGCGLGRFTIASNSLGAGFVIGVDLSDAVDVAFENTRDRLDVLIVQADILRLPIRRVVDYAFSVGVLHHTADPRGAFLHVASKVVPGGGISAWVYGRENNGWIVYGVDPIRRVTSRLPRPVLLALSHLAALPLTVIVKTVYGPVARHRRVSGLGRYLFYFDYLAFLAQFGYREHAFIIFDHAVPSIARYIRRDEFVEWFSAAGLERVVVTMRGGNSWRGFGMMPSGIR